MEITKWKDTFDIISNLTYQSIELANAFVKDNSDVDDWCMMCRIGEKLRGLQGLLRAENDFGAALYEMKKIKSSDEDEKFIFIVDKRMHSYLKDVLIPFVEDILKRSRTLRFEDYRARNFQNDLRRAMEDIKRHYKELYNL